MGIHDCADVKKKKLKEKSGLEKIRFQARILFVSLVNSVKFPDKFSVSHCGIQKPQCGIYISQCGIQILHCETENV